MEFSIEQIDKKIKSDLDMRKLALDDPTEFDTRVAQIYKEFGYREDGSPIPAAQRAFTKVEKATGIPAGVTQAVAALPIPLATTALGATAGVLGGPPAAFAGMAGGSLLGEEVNAALGITEPLSTGEKALALGAPLLGPAAMRAKGLGKSVLQHLPGSQAGVHELASETFEESLKKMRVTEAQVTTARNFANQAPNVRIELPGLRALLNQEKENVLQRSEFPGMEKYAEVLHGFLDELSHGPMSMKKILAWEKGANLQKLSNPNEVWGKMAGTIISDMEAAVMNPKLSAASRQKIGDSVAAFKTMVQVSRKYKADEALDGVLKRVVTPLADDPSLLSFNKKQFVRELKNNDTLKSVFSTREIEDMREAVEGIGYVSKNVSHLLQKYSTAGAVMTGGAYASGVPVGGFIPAVLITNEIIRKSLMSDMGRKVIKYLSKQGQGKLNLADLDSILGQITAGVGTGGAAALKSQSPFKPLGREE